MNQKRPGPSSLLSSSRVSAMETLKRRVRSSFFRKERKG